jgi:hypothetical protein
MRTELKTCKILIKQDWNDLAVINYKTGWLIEKILERPRHIK